MADYVIKQNDQGASIDVLLEEYDATAATWGPIDLSDVVTVRLLMKSPTAAVTGVGEILDPLAGTVRYVWDSDDLDFAGEYRAEHELTYASGVIETVPNGAVPDRQYFTVEVVEDLG